jgi:hypothetical protein
MDNHQDLIKLIKSASPIAPPDDFSSRVMARLQVLDQGVWSQVRQTLLNPVPESLYTGLVQKLSVSGPRECSFCFFITGFFYLIMGIVLMAGFEAIGSSMAAGEWIILQPYLTIGAAIWLFALGVVLMLDGSAGIKAAKYGTLLYVFFTVFNGILMRPYLNVPYAGVFIIGFVAASALIGIMLSLAVQKMELRTV